MYKNNKLVKTMRLKTRLILLLNLINLFLFSYVFSQTFNDLDNYVMQGVFGMFQGSGKQSGNALGGSLTTGVAMGSLEKAMEQTYPNSCLGHN